MDEDGQEWVNLGRLWDLVLFLGSENNTGKFAALASHLPFCKGSCIVFSVPRFEPSQFSGKAKGHDTYVADLQTRTIQPLEESPGYCNSFQPPPNPFSAQS